jgi:fucose permease
MRTWIPKFASGDRRCACGPDATDIYNTFVFDHGVEISPQAYHARAAGLLFAYIFFGAAINPFVAGTFEQGFGLHHSLVVMALVSLLCGLPVVLRRDHSPAYG